MTNGSNDQALITSKKEKSEALGKGLWKALWIAIAICILWLILEGGFRLYQRPAILDARVSELEKKIVTVENLDTKFESSLKRNSESQKSLVAVAGKMSEMLNAIGTLPMTALPAPSSSPELKVDESQKSPWLKKIFDQIKLLGDRLVRVQVVGDVRDISLTPAAQDLIRQQLKLHLLSARMAWLSNLPQTCRDDLNQAQTLLAKHFQPQASSVISFEKALIDLKAEVEKSSALMKGQ
jgi:hypothetical protein